MDESVSRRHFLSRSFTGLSAVWASANWPALLAAARHAHQAAKSAAPPKFVFFTADEAKEIDAITSRIIPSDETPGAHEAGVVYFIDPDYGGNHAGAGWKVIGREREHMFQPPFGYYDKGYPGWEAAPKEEANEAGRK